MDDAFLASLTELLRTPGFDGCELIQVLKSSPSLAECFGAQLGGVDGLTLEDHTLDALQTFSRCFELDRLPLLSAASFKLLLAVHDIGKPQAVAEGRLERQHVYTLKRIDDALNGLAWPSQQMTRIRSLIDGDPIGACLNRKHLLPVVDAGTAIKTASAGLSVDVREYWDGLLIYYQCDSAAYPSVRAKVFEADSVGALRVSTTSGHFPFREPDENLRFEALRAEVLAGSKR